MIKQYKKKSAVIDAIQWTGDNLREIINFIGWHESASQKWTWEEYEYVVANEGLKIFTLYGPIMASIGDYIIKDIDGECFPCEQEIFDEIYDGQDNLRIKQFKYYLKYKKSQSENDMLKEALNKIANAKTEMYRQGFETLKAIAKQVLIITDNIESKNIK